MAVSNTHCLSNRDVENVAAKVVQELGCEALKPEQLQIVVGVWREHDVFACVAHWLWENFVLLRGLPAFRLRQDISKKRAFHRRGSNAARCGLFSSNTRTCKLP